MKKVLLKSNGGFSLAESLISLSISTMFLTSVLSAWHYSTLIWKQENAQSDLRFSLESAMEKIKADVRLSNADTIVYYPPAGSGGPYSAVSIPAVTKDANGFFARTSTIAWDKTIIYHVYTNNGMKELRRTVYNSFNSSYAARQAQLNDVVADGKGSENSTTTTICKTDTVTFKITPLAAVFDGYSPTTQLSPSTNFGNVLLTPGMHQITFAIVNKNPLSSGYRMGIDSITLSPSGGSQEAETLSYSSTSPTAVEDMSALGGWGGNYHVEFQASKASEFAEQISFTINYDQWSESNFENMTYSSSAVYGTNPHLSIQSREDQGLAPSWNITSQTQSMNAVPTALSNKSIRCVIAGASITKPATMIRIKFLAGAAPLVVNSAYFGQRNLSTANFAGGTTQLYFNNAPVQEGGSDGVGAVGTTEPTSITIPAGYYAWSNWFEYPITLPVTGDFLVSVYVSTGNASAWTDVTPTNTHSYQVDDSDGSYANTTTNWATLPNYQASATGYAVAEMAAWVSTSVTTSQVYDTKMASPAYNQLSWDPILPSGSSVSLKIRTSGNVNMSGASAWSALTAHTSPPVSLGGLANLRYVQFQAALQAASPYASFPEVDDVKITWPGQTAFVNISGKYTKKPNYGTFQLLAANGMLPVRALTASLTLSSAYRDKTITESLSSEVKVRNTGR